MCQRCGGARDGGGRRRGRGGGGGGGGCGGSGGELVWRHLDRGAGCHVAEVVEVIVAVLARRDLRVCRADDIGEYKIGLNVRALEPSAPVIATKSACGM